MKATYLVILTIAFTAKLEIKDIGDRNHHLICHTHNDLGWLKTIREYYDSSVIDIFQTVIESLEATETSAKTKRKFHYSEVGFLKMFIEDDQPTREGKIKKIKEFINKGQWEWVNGGIAQADEACPFYEDLINNYFYGQRYLKKWFGTNSKTAWQLDPFGHSLTLYYLASKFGMKHAVFGRMDERTRAQWTKEKRLEMIYKLPEGREIILHVNNGYGPPASLSCDRNCEFSHFNKHEFELDCQNHDRNFISDTYFTIGSDFHWTKAKSRYNFLDQVVSSYDTVKYSLFSEFAAEFEKNVPRNSLSTFEGDFFVYDEGKDQEYGDSWSGYFTTKPYLKYKIRRIGRILRTVTSFNVAPKYYLNSHPKITSHKTWDLIDLSEDFGVLTHHDAITGTSKEAVDKDYLNRIASLEVNLNVPFGVTNKESLCDPMDLYAGQILECAYTSRLRTSRKMMLLIYNPQPNTRTVLNLIFVPKIDTRQTVNVNPIGREDIRGLDMFCFEWQTFCHVFFKHPMWPVEYQQYLVTINLPKNDHSEIDNQDNSKAINTLKKDIKKKGFVEFITVESRSKMTLMKKTNRYNSRILTRIGADKMQSGFTVFTKPVLLRFPNFSLRILSDRLEFYNEKGEITFFSTYYQMAAGDSGHYILKYNGNYEKKLYSEVTAFKEFMGDLISGIIIRGTKIDTLVYREADKKYFKLYTIVKQDVDFNSGMDLLMEINAERIDNKQDVFYTDSNGLFEVERRNRAKFENSVYPVTSYARILSDDGSKGMYVFNDRTQGAYVKKNTLGFYIQRSASVEDHKGNEEVLRVTETNCMCHYLYMYEDPEDSDETFAEITSLIDSEMFNVHLPMAEDEDFLQPEMGIKPQDLLEYSPYIRLNVQLIDNERSLFRYQNISRKKTVTANFGHLMHLYYPKSSFFEVEFDYVVHEPEKESPLKDTYELKPLEFVTILRYDPPNIDLKQ